MGLALRFLFLLGLKTFSRVFFRFTVTWCGAPPTDPYRDVRVILLLNHTSLFEFIFIGIVPLPLLWRLAAKGTVPGADITLNRPLTGLFFKAFARSVVTITRRRDETWDAFLDSVNKDSLVLMLPEGRMKRPTGLDKDGQPMTVRGGIADLLLRSKGGRMLVAYSGGLHHIQAPGERFPRFFRRVFLALEVLDIEEYKRSHGADGDEKTFKRFVIEDLQRRRDEHCPTAT